METILLNNGVQMPVIGMGVYQIKENAQCENTVAKALDLGYRLIDTAQSYGNEEAVGRAIRNSEVPREEIFVTTKIKVANLTYENTKRSFFASLEKLHSDYLDLLLIHHPYNDVYGAWRAMQELQKEGYVRAIGVSNFPPDRLEYLILHGGKNPQLVQFEIHPFYQQKDSINLLKRHQIRPEAWGPLAQGEFGIFENKTLKVLANKHNKSIAQIVLRWLLQCEVSVIPKSVHEQRLQENLNVFDFTLSKEEMEQIVALDQNTSTTPQMRQAE